MAYPKSPAWADGDVWNAAAVNDLETRGAAFARPALAGTAVAYAGTITPAIAGTIDAMVNVGTVTGTLLVANPTGTPADGQFIRFRFAQDGTGHAISWGTNYAFGTDITSSMIPATASAKFEALFEYNTADSKWRAVGLARGF